MEKRKFIGGSFCIKHIDGKNTLWLCTIDNRGYTTIENVEDYFLKLDFNNINYGVTTTLTYEILLDRKTCAVIHNLCKINKNIKGTLNSAVIIENGLRDMGYIPLSSLEDRKSLAFEMREKDKGFKPIEDPILVELKNVERPDAFCDAFQALNKNIKNSYRVFVDRKHVNEDNLIDSKSSTYKILNHNMIVGNTMYHKWLNGSYNYVGLFKQISQIYMLNTTVQLLQNTH